MSVIKMVGAFKKSKAHKTPPKNTIKEDNANIIA
jgi:hypothetical protein